MPELPYVDARWPLGKGGILVDLALAHRQSQSCLKELMSKRGGYILHVDGTREGDSPNLFCGVDGIRELVLDTVKIPSEKKERHQR